jgi:hypothetical protein
LSMQVTFRNIFFFRQKHTPFNYNFVRHWFMHVIK